MTKVERARFRHILVRVASPKPMARREFQEALKARLAAARWMGPEVRLTRHEHPHAALQVEHTHALALRHVLQGSWGPFAVETLRTSGTLRALGDATGVLPPRAEK